MLLSLITMPIVLIYLISMENEMCLVRKVLVCEFVVHEVHENGI